MKKWLGPLLFILGLSLLCYPDISNYVISLNQRGIISNYKKNIQIKGKKQLKKAQQKLQKKQMVKQTVVNDHFNKKNNTAYGSKPVALIAIPSINVELPVFTGTSDKILDQSAGLVNGTNLPTGKKGQHSLITAHRGLPGAQLFTDLPRLKIAEKFYLKNAYGLMTYKIDHIKTVKATNTNPIQLNSQTNQVTLMTCTPYMINTHRLLVTGHRIPNESKSIPKAQFVWDWYKILLLVIGICVTCYLIYRLIFYIKTRKRGN